MRKFWSLWRWWWRLNRWVGGMGGMLGLRVFCEIWELCKFFLMIGNCNFKWIVFWDFFLVWRFFWWVEFEVFNVVNMLFDVVWFVSGCVRSGWWIVVIEWFNVLWMECWKVFVVMGCFFVIRRESILVMFFCWKLKIFE